jgi:hypothetical protein
LQMQAVLPATIQSLGRRDIDAVSNCPFCANIDLTDVIIRGNCKLWYQKMKTRM